MTTPHSVVEQTVHALQLKLRLRLACGPQAQFLQTHQVLAQLGGRAAVISLARLRQEFYWLEPDREVFIERARKEALHETGHLFGLVHCADRSCAMSLATNVRHIDEKRDGWCGACAGQLHRALGAMG